MNLDLFYNACGLFGMGLFLIVYALLQTGKLSVADIRYCFGNCAGAVLILISLWHDWNLSAFLLEVAWLAISLYGIFRYYRTQKANL